ncbi:pyridoxal phosphate-dependent transferase, partial [Baffinella frigidus]
RDQFLYPLIFPEDPSSPDCIYLCGNSLGLQPVRARAYVLEEMDRWARGGVRGHFEGPGRHWAEIDDLMQPPAARQVMAPSMGEVVIREATGRGLDTTDPSEAAALLAREGCKILMEAKAFPSDRYIVESQVKFHVLDPAEVIVQLLTTPDIIAAIEREGSSLAMVFFPGVQYYTGQLFDIKGITEAAHSQGAIAGFDLAHAAGNAALQLHDWGVDFACWCTYKYLNAGPGAIAATFVHEKHGQDESLQRFAGWWGHDEGTRFDMTKPFKPEPGAKGFQLSNPPILQCVALLASLEIFDEVGMPALRAKSDLLTGLLLFLLQRRIPGGVSIITPTDPARRGAQVSVVLDRPIKKVFQALECAGVVCDMREPDVIRLAPCPLYNTFTEVPLKLVSYQTVLIVYRDPACTIDV